MGSSLPFRHTLSTSRLTVPSVAQLIHVTLMLAQEAIVTG